ncbi:MAG: hypothetical protein ACREV6_02140 [Clostridium sp.]|uniref:hypothetical protein n=1 Tax=Clostridium sp. TaxID=1506 RepID=UPI003D6D9D42
MDISGSVKLVYQLMLMSNKIKSREIVTALDEEIREYLHEIENVVFTRKTLSLEVFDMYDLIKYRYMEDYRVQCDYVLNLGYVKEQC